MASGPLAADPGAALPRLAVVTDVPVERTNGGMLLLYRLLARYPADRLTVVQGDQFLSGGPEVRLPGVRYEPIATRSPLPRWAPGRFDGEWQIGAAVRLRRRAGRLDRSLAGFRPDAVLTVIDGALWLAAAAYARRAGLPLHLLVHDDHPSKMVPDTSTLRAAVRVRVYRRWVRGVYRQAVTRFVVSPGMADWYRQLYGVGADVLYPNRGPDSPAPRVRVPARPHPDGPVLAFAGAPYLDGNNQLLRRAAEVAARHGGRVDLYTRHDLPPELVHPAVRVAGFFPPHELAERMAATAHMLFVPGSFLPRDRVSVSTLFPSKLADYTAIGLPVLMWGAEYSSAVRWARENPGAAEVVTAPDGAGLEQAVLKLAGDPHHARRLAEGAVAAGDKCFGLDAAWAAFAGRLASAAPPGGGA